MEARIRTAVARDLPVLTALAQRTYAEAYGQDMTQVALEWHLNTHLSPQRMNQMLRRDTFLVAETDQMIGFVQFGEAGRADLTGTDTSGAEVRRLYVAAHAQNRGTGTLLLQAALDHPRIEAFAGVYVGVWHTNLGARRLYARFGFVQVGEKPYLDAEGASPGADLLLRRSRMRV
ncbi:GNAT family N-acetyltransferase [Deinococcus altitudinis]|uniref:GNAT family N-acetyltransferase n=1 Tax=Deinococcus altitudinis TaxID=468914 RepID=UPI0038918FE7